MYKLENEEVVDQLPEYMTENNHISQYILEHSEDVERADDLIRSQSAILRTSSTKCVLVDINGVRVWCKEAEYQEVKKVLPKVRDQKILMWYVAGSISPIDKEGTRVSALDGYEIHFLYNKL